MIVPTPRSKQVFLKRLRNWLIGLWLSVAVCAASAFGQAPAGEPVRGEEASVDGVFISVSNRIDSLVLSRVKSQMDRFRDRPDKRGLKIVLDFNADGGPSRTDDYGVCRDFAKYLLGIQDATTIAFVRNDVTGHTVLPVLACKEVVMSKKARIGNVTGTQGEPLEPDILAYYTHLAERRRYFPAIILKMADPKMEVIEGNRAGGAWYVDALRLDEEVKNNFVPAVRRDPVLMAGKAGFYDAAQAQKFGLCQVHLETRADVRELYQMPTTSLREDPLQGRTPVAYRLIVSGKVDRTMKERLGNRLRQTVRKGANLIFLQLECGDGETLVAQDLAETIRTLRDNNGENPVMTVAIVTREARNTAVFLALGCSEIVMDQKAQLGGFEQYVSQAPQLADKISASLASLAEKQGYPALLVRGMLEPNLAIHQVSRRGKAFERRLMDSDQLNEDAEKTREWVNEGPVKPFGAWLTLDSSEAKRHGVAKFVFEGEPQQLVTFLRDKYGLDERQPTEVKSDWLEDFAEFLCSPVVAMFLIMIGIIGLILELKVPGVGVPGVVAAICFVLYFWSQSQLQGQLTMLAILLFLLGLILIGLEVFLVPGLGVPGISGIVLVVVSLGLATVVKKPETQHEWMEFGTTLTTISVSLLGAVAGALALAYYLPNIPWANRLVLIPPAETTAPLEEESGTSLAYASLLGAIGEAATTLRPAGKARFGDDFVDVVAEGNYVKAGSRVQVIEIEGNRIVVKEV